MPLTSKTRSREVDATLLNVKDLERVRFFKCLKDLYPRVKVELVKNGKIILKVKEKCDLSGLEDAYDMCFKTLQELNIVERNLSLSLEEKWKWDIVAHSDCQAYLDKMMSHDVKAEVCV